MNWDRARRNDGVSLGPAEPSGLIRGVGRKREVLAALGWNSRKMPPEQIESLYIGLSPSDIKRANDIRSGRVKVANAGIGGLPKKLPPRQRKLTATAEIRLRKKLIAEVKDSSPAGKAVAFRRATKEFDRLDAEALRDSDKRLTKNELARVKRAHSEWRRRLEQAR